MTASRLVQRPRARRDLLKIVAYIRERNPSAARVLVDAYEQALRTLRAHPEAGRRYSLDHAALGDLRVLPVPGYSDYVIFSRYDGSTVEIVRVIHGARDILAALEREH